MEGTTLLNAGCVVQISENQRTSKQGQHLIVLIQLILVPSKQIHQCVLNNLAQLLVNVWLIKHLNITFKGEPYVPF